MVMATVLIDNFAPTINFTIDRGVLKSQYVEDTQITDANDDNGGRGNNVSGNDDNDGVSAKQLIGDALRRKVEGVDHEMCDPGDEDAFFVADLGEVYRQHIRWKRNLPRVKPFYAVKCNPDPKVLQLLAALGTGFDCASKWEIEQALKMGVSPDRIIYAQPCKTNSYVRFAKAAGVKQMTFDNADELHKIARLHPGAELFLRIMTDDTSSLCRLSMKFGAASDATDGLLALARDLKLNVVGVSFHVGSGASDPMAFLKAVRDAHRVFLQAQAYGFEMRTLDVGGGFCGDTFEAMADVLGAALDDYFPPHSGVDLIAEPGRFYVSSAFTLACSVIARRTVEDPTLACRSYMVYVNDGLYGNFSSIMFDHQNPAAKLLVAGGEHLYGTPQAAACCPSASSPDRGDGVEYSLWGPTCDGIDRIAESVRFDRVIDVGDWLYFDDMGAYTKCSATTFNGFSNEHDVVYVCSDARARATLGM